MEDKKEESPRTPCGYRAGNLQASDGTMYQVKKTGQIVRLEGVKMTKAERKKQRRQRRKK